MCRKLPELHLLFLMSVRSIIASGGGKSGQTPRGRGNRFASGPTLLDVQQALRAYCLSDTGELMIPAVPFIFISLHLFEFRARTATLALLAP